MKPTEILALKTINNEYGVKFAGGILEELITMLWIVDGVLKFLKDSRCNILSQIYKKWLKVGIQMILFVCLFGFNVAFKHLRSYHNSACL